MKTYPTRRRLLTATAGLIAGACLTSPTRLLAASAISAKEPFWGKHQGGIITPAQSHTYFASFDVITPKREDLALLMQRWTTASARMSQGQTAEPLDADGQKPGADSADVVGVSPSRLTITFGFGTTLFTKDGQDRFGLASQRPEAFVDMPNFPGDQMVPEHTGGDLSIQACADDPQVAFHAVRQLARLAKDVAVLRWVQAGFIANFGAKDTPRNLMGFKDGTGNPNVNDQAEMDKFIWAGNEAPIWMRGGSYVVMRRSRMALEHWDKTNVAFQEETFGRQKMSGAPIGKHHEKEPLDLAATDKDGNPVIAENAHVRLASAMTNDGVKILRRSYSYNDGANMIAERWPPWRQGLEYDAGLIFVCYQRDPRTGFISIFDKLSRFDMMNQFVTNVGGGYFACPAGATEGHYIGQTLLESV